MFVVHVKDFSKYLELVFEKTLMIFNKKEVRQIRPFN